MSGPWHKRHPELLERERAEVQAEYPQLNFAEREELIWIRGSFPVLHDGEVVDRYLIEVRLPRDYPESLPAVWEIGGCIPRRPDAHVNPQDGTACVLLPDERWRAWPVGATLLHFFKVPVHNFFLGQSLVRRGGAWPFGQWGHGVEGIIEYYSDLLGTDDVRVMGAYLDVLSRTAIKGHLPCPCGSGRRLRDCHHQRVQDLAKKIPRSVALKSFDQVRRTLGSHPAASGGGSVG